MFHEADFHAMLLFGSKTWNLTLTAMKRLEDCHIWAAYQMAHTNKSRRSPNGEWTYPSSEDMLLSEVGMHTIADYIVVRRQMIASFIIKRPIFSFCEAGEQRHGTSQSQFWFEQPMDLDAARALADPEPDFGQEPVKPT